MIRLTRVGRIQFQGISRLSYKSNADSRIVLSNDLYLLSPNKHHDSFYERSIVDFKSKFGDDNLPVSLDSELGDQLQEFLGEEFPLLVTERNGVLFGLNNIILNVPHAIHTDRLRIMGKTLFELHLQLFAVFSNYNYLSLSADDISHNLSVFKDRRYLVTQYMIKNSLYNRVIPYQGAMRTGPIRCPEEYKDVKRSIRDDTCIGSFYTLIGLLNIKFDRQRVVQDFLHEKVFNGPSGIISIAAEVLQGRE